MALTRHDDYVRERIRRDPEFARLMHESGLELLDGNDEDRRVALRILCGGFDLTEEEIRTLERKDAAT